MMTEQELDKQAEILQNMSLKELKSVFSGDKTYVTASEPTEAEKLAYKDEMEFTEEELMLQNMSLKEVKALFKNSKAIAEKTAKTGLSEKAIKRVEENRKKATLEEIIAYCQGLKISFQDFIPELFTDIKVNKARNKSA